MSEEIKTCGFQLCKLRGGHLRTLCPQTRIIWCSDLNFSLHAFRLRADYFAVLSVALASLIPAFECCLSGAAVSRQTFPFWVLTFNS